MYLFFKRIFDLFFSCFLILLFSSIIIVIILVLLFFNKGDVFFAQERVGYKNKMFRIIKFSSMLRNSKDLPGGTITLRNDPRVSKIGKFLRITKLNELPQLFNVLIGNMSFVGPRPLLTEGFSWYSDDVKDIILNLKPGITGISSIVFRDEEKIVTEASVGPEEFYKSRIFPYKGQLEKWYFENKTFSLDLMILFITGIKVIVPRINFEFRLFASIPKSEYFKF